MLVRSEHVLTLKSDVKAVCCGWLLICMSKGTCRHCSNVPGVRALLQPPADGPCSPACARTSLRLSCAICGRRHAFQSYVLQNNSAPAESSAVFSSAQAAGLNFKCARMSCECARMFCKCAVVFRFVKRREVCNGGRNVRGRLAHRHSDVGEQDNLHRHFNFIDRFHREGSKRFQLCPRSVHV